MPLIRSCLDSIGNNPIVRLNKMVPEGSAEIYVLLEYFNPSGSVKDRIAVLRVARDLGPGRKVVTLAPDSCNRYFSTALFKG